MTATFFPTPAHLRRWLERHHASRTELIVGLYKRDAGHASITWPELVDQVLCFGWIDGIRRTIDQASYSIRITPRKKTSIWSKVNIGRVAALTKLGLMQPTGLEAFKARSAEKSGIYSYENRHEVHSFPPAYETRFKAKPKAWKFFGEQAPWYRQTTIRWVMSAKRDVTQVKRLVQLITDSAAGRRIGQLYRAPRG